MYRDHENCFRDEYFVIDTGGPYSYITTNHLNDLKHTMEKIPENVYENKEYTELVEGEYKTVMREIVHTAPKVTVYIEGCPVTFIVTDETYWRENVRGINLLGTNFINEFYMSDDFHNQQIKFMKPAYKKAAFQSSINAFR